MAAITGGSANLDTAWSAATHAKLSPTLARGVLVLVIAAATIAGFVLTGPVLSERAVAQAGPDLTHLLRAMALLKVALALLAGAAVLWRLGAAVTFAWLAAYAVACAGMAAGPGLIWAMAHVGMGALLLHGGLVASAVLLWRDPVVGTRLAAAVAARRAGLRRS